MPSAARFPEPSRYSELPCRGTGSAVEFVKDGIHVRPWCSRCADLASNYRATKKIKDKTSSRSFPPYPKPTLAFVGDDQIHLGATEALRLFKAEARGPFRRIGHNQNNLEQSWNTVTSESSSLDGPCCCTSFEADTIEWEFQRELCLFNNAVTQTITSGPLIGCIVNPR